MARGIPIETIIKLFCTMKESMRLCAENRLLGDPPLEHFLQKSRLPLHFSSDLKNSFYAKSQI